MRGKAFRLEVICSARDRGLPKAWWSVNATNLASLALTRQTKLALPAGAIVTASLDLVRGPRIRELNSEYRQLDRETDVLSFPQENPPDAAVYELGDIVISLTSLFAQAAEYGHSPEREAAFLFTHGFLHLLGYDHVSPSEETEMLELQKGILKSVGFGR